jgi:hypothetical protein
MTAFNSLLTLLFRVHVLALPQIPEDPLDDLTDWFSESSSVFIVLKDALQSFHLNRNEQLNSMQRKSKDLLWWPFTQHNLVPQDSVTVIDSRCGENFSAYKVCTSSTLYSFFSSKDNCNEVLVTRQGWMNSKSIISKSSCRLKTTK